MPPVEIVRNRQRQAGPLAPEMAGSARLARKFHATLPGSASTPLVRLPGLAARLGVRAVFVKDESQRFGLEAFKGLGSSWAVARVLGERLGLAPERLDFAGLRAARPQLGELTFVTATDGNHGRGLAWAARLLGHRARVFMPAGAAAARVAAIREQGAQCVVTDLAYDDAVRHAAAHARELDAILVQDTAWDGYEQIPSWIMEGYGTLALETAEQLAVSGPDGSPSHIFLQAGVGSFAAAVLASLGAALGASGAPRPAFVSVEPHAADCVFRSIRAADENPRTCPGSLETLMAGLSCGEVSRLAWPLLRAGLAAACAVSDDVARCGMRLLARPEAGDPPLVSGESGAVGAGLLHWLMQPEPGARGASARARELLGLGRASTVLLISTEGATNPTVWEAVTGDAAPARGEPGS
ncbi:diaminopropionate ammonia-lyase [Desulfovibrio sp.]|uniref:diaminopropionate ammonia-lyase n=1 Tax=Desulfovibrio sp. TaxID=885 RepID=UPI0023C0FB70|nr:diaminopropionate ammonia-lyase [Desulfovibrio sp.]MDE7240938.1 diaminopropionate ammonia-lyase [Desulfovibrio sp.]